MVVGMVMIMIMIMVMMMLVKDCGKDDCATKSDSFGPTYFVGDDSFGLVHDGHTGNLGSQFSIFKCKVCQLLFF